MKKRSLHVKLPCQLIDELTAEAKKRGFTLTALVREILEKHGPHKKKERSRYKNCPVNCNLGCPECLPAEEDTANEQIRSNLL